VISPLLGNIYLHYVLDLWDSWRRREARGDMVIVRYPDDLVIGFEHEEDARCLLDAMHERFAAFAVSLHPNKIRLIEFGRHARPIEGSAASADRKPLHFWAHPICGRSRRGYFQLQRKTRRDRLRAKLLEIKAEL
jgi:hypothetical protein